MNFTYETQGTSTFLVYTMGEREQLDAVVMGMMSNNKIEGVLPFSFTRLDQERFVRYNVSSRISLAQYFNGIVNKNRLLKVLISMASAVLEAENYMLEPETFVWNKNYIFVDVSTSEAELVCLPVLQDPGKSVDLEAIFKDMFFGVQFDQTENCDYVAKLLGFFNSGTHFGLQEFLKLLKEIDGQKTEKSEIKAQPDVPLTVSVQQPVRPVPPAPSGQSETAVKPVTCVQNVIPVQSTQPVPPVLPAKKGFHLFEKKEKPPKGQKLSKDKNFMGNQALPGRSNGIVPGQFQSPGAVPAVPEEVKNIPQTNQKTAGKQGIGSSYVTSDYATQQAGFGGTVVLNAGNKSQGTVVLNAQNASQEALKLPYLQSERNKNKLIVNKGIIKIGSDSSYADYVITDNKAVSRSHAEIRLKGANVYLVDCNSTNHTYVNNKLLLPNMEELLRDGCIVKFADEEFEFHMS